MRVAILGAGRGWHLAQLEQALSRRGHRSHVLPIASLVARIGGGPALSSAGIALSDCDAVFVRIFPKGSLEQMVFRVDALHALAARGVRIMNPAFALERTIDKFFTSALLEAKGLPTPRTVVAERAEDALLAFESFGDVIVKPLFGSAGRGMVRVSDPEIAHRVFRALDLERAVYYVQETIPHPGRDLRVFVVGERVIAAAWRCAVGWRTNVAQGARMERVDLEPEWRDLSLRAARAVGAEYAGVDLLPLPDGRVYVLEVNGIPGWSGLQAVADVDLAGAMIEHLEAVVARRS